jgi:hypothetical protein
LSIPAQVSGWIATNQVVDNIENINAKKNVRVKIFLLDIFTLIFSKEIKIGKRKIKHKKPSSCGKLKASDNIRAEKKN